MNTRSIDFVQPILPVAVLVPLLDRAYVAKAPDLTPFRFVQVYPAADAAIVTEIAYVLLMNLSPRRHHADR